MLVKHTNRSYLRIIFMRNIIIELGTEKGRRSLLHICAEHNNSNRYMEKVHKKRAIRVATP